MRSNRMRSTEDDLAPFGPPYCADEDDAPFGCGAGKARAPPYNKRHGRGHTVDTNKNSCWRGLLFTARMVMVAYACLMLSICAVPVLSYPEMDSHRHDSSETPEHVREGESMNRMVSEASFDATGRACPQPKATEELSGFVFGMQHDGSAESIHVIFKTVLEAAGAHVRVFDNPPALQEIIRHCRGDTSCSPYVFSGLLQSEIGRLLDEESTAAASLSCGEAGSFQGSGTCPTLQDHFEIEGATPPCAQSSGYATTTGEEMEAKSLTQRTTNPESVHESVEEGLKIGLAESAADGNKCPKANNAKHQEDSDCTTERDGQRVTDVENIPAPKKAPEPEELARDVDGEAIRGSAEHILAGMGPSPSMSPGEQKLSGEGRRFFVIVVLSDWAADEIQALLTAFPRTPWLYLHSDILCIQENTAEAILKLSSIAEQSTGISPGIILANDIGTSAAARVLTRHFGVPVEGMGELQMAKVYARVVKRYADTSTRRGNSGSSHKRTLEADAALGGECPVGTSPVRAKTSRRLRRLAAESSKVLGGSFDTDKWYVPAADANIAESNNECSDACQSCMDARHDQDHDGGDCDEQIRRQNSRSSPERKVSVDNGTEPWRKGLRRMVDGDSPSWMSSEVYSEPRSPFDCPELPTEEYPREWPLSDVLSNWNPGNASSGVPPTHFLGVCRFDYKTELHKAQAYSLAEVPFIMYNIPALDKAVREWSDPLKLSASLGKENLQIDVSPSNRFLYHNRKRDEHPEGWSPPTTRKHGTFDSWLLKALRPEPPDRVNSTAVNSDHEGSREHFYLKLSHTDENPLEFVRRSLPFFAGPEDSTTAGAKNTREGKASRNRSRDTVEDAFASRRRTSSGNTGTRFDNRSGTTADHPSKLSGKKKGRKRRRSPSSDKVEASTASKSGARRHDDGRDEGAGKEGRGLDGVNVFLRDARASKGIHCRIGMEGVMTEAHYDGSRNMVALLAGKRRWILSHPRNSCEMYMYHRSHPSARHTSVDWTDPDVMFEYPRLADATANEVVLRAGEALYVPEHWIHSIVNIGVSAQCNSRSGRSHVYDDIIHLCEARMRAGQ